MFPPYLCRPCSICHSRRSAPTRHSWARDKARWGLLDACSCPVMGTHTILMSSFLGPLCPPSFAKGLDVIMKVIIHPLCFLSHAPSSLCVHYKPITHWSITVFFSNCFWWGKKKKLSSSLLLLSSVIYIMIHDASLLYKQWINLLDYPCMCV